MKEADIKKLVELVARLRGPHGCPWDKEQTRETLKPMLVEEAYEVLDALDDGDPQPLKEELGDLLFQVVFHSQIAAERGEFTLADVIDRIYEKMVRRHPHVFGEADYKTAADVLRNWEDIKAAEKGSARKASLLDGSPKFLPPLNEAYQLTAKAARVGFDWSHIEEVFDKLQEEIGEARTAIQSNDSGKIRDEIGDLLFVVVNIARFLNVDAESALRRTNQKFIRRFHYIEERLKAQGKSINESNLAEMDALWQEAKTNV
ncbi:MAG: nucleoside triphosphate pyrophosphohydrolase [Acidobacteria bacterium]|nr:nucleoside triphosphate pyrophosphohydrolase [Acidobacteriota bacterium]